MRAVRWKLWQSRIGASAQSISPQIAAARTVSKSTAIASPVQRIRLRTASARALPHARLRKAARCGPHVEVGRADSDPTEATAIDGQQPSSLCVARTGAIGAASERGLLCASRHVRRGRRHRCGWVSVVLAVATGQFDHEFDSAATVRNFLNCRPRGARCAAGSSQSVVGVH